MGLGYGQAQEVAQEALLRAWRHLGQYDPGRGSFSTWLFTIARNLAVDELARIARRPDGVHVDDLAEPPEAPWEGPEPQQALELDRRRRALHAALKRLPVADRGVLALAYLSELDIPDIARIEHCTAGAIKSRLHRARNRLAELLENQDARELR